MSDLRDIPIGPTDVKMPLFQDDNLDNEALAIKANDASAFLGIMTGVVSEQFDSVNVDETVEDTQKQADTTYVPDDFPVSDWAPEIVDLVDTDVDPDVLLSGVPSFARAGKRSHRLPKNMADNPEEFFFQIYPRQHSQ